MTVQEATKWARRELEQHLHYTCGISDVELEVIAHMMRVQYNRGKRAPLVTGDFSTRDASFYNAKGQLDPNGAYARVSSVLAVRHEPQIEAYKLRKVLEGGFEALEADKAFYTERGTAVHEAIETYLRRGEQVVLPQGYGPYFEGFLKWHDKHQPTSCIMEIPVRSEKHLYAGRVDLACQLDGETWIVDFKTSKSMRPSMGLQLAAYRQAYYEMTGVWARTAILQLAPELKRGYRWKEYDEEGDFNTFLAHLDIFEWQQQQQLQKAQVEEKLAIEIAL